MDLATPSPKPPQAKRWLWIIVAILLVAFVTVARLQWRQIALLNEAVHYDGDNVAWSFFQFEVEYLKLRDTLREFERDPSRFDRDALRTRYDIFVSRVTLVDLQRTMAHMETRPIQTETVARARGFVAAADVFLGPDAARPVNTEAVRSMLARLEPLGEAIHDMAAWGNETMAAKIGARNEAVQQQNHISLAVTIFQWLLTVVFAVIVVRQLRALEQRGSALEGLAARLQAALREAEDASRAKGAFLANMSHELRTPLNAVIGAAQLLKAGGTDVESQSQLTEVIQRSGTNLLGLIENILDLSCIEAGELHLRPEDFDLVDCIEAALYSVALPARAKGLALACIVDPEVVTWRHGDPSRLRQVFLNLLGNAVKFTPSGEIVVHVQRGVDADALRVSVSDTGVGIGAASLPHIFEHFRQADDGTDRRFGGSGLGLSIVRHLIEAMGGRISVSSELGRGSRFEFELFLPAAVATLQMPQAPELRDLRVAYYEPHEPSAQALAAQLQRLGCQGRRVHNCEELREWLSAAPCRPGPPWMMVATDGAQAGPMLESAVDSLDPARVIGMTQAGLSESELARKTPRLPRSISKPVPRGALVSWLGAVRRTEPGELVTVPAQLMATEHAAQSTHVLVVEDDPVNQTIVCWMLSNAGYLSTAANGGAQALALLAERHFDLVLMDWQMPDMDGLEVTRQIRAGGAGPAAQQIPIVALTANAFVEDRAACLAAGMNDFLTKPVLAERLSATVELWTRGTRGAGPALARRLA